MNGEAKVGVGANVYQYTQRAQHTKHDVFPLWIFIRFLYDSPVPAQIANSVEVNLYFVV